jgi:signal transduction histidine kinase
MSEKKQGFSRRFAAFFAFVFIVPAIILFYLLYLVIAAELSGIRMEDLRNQAETLRNTEKKLHLQIKDAAKNIKSSSEYVDLILKYLDDESLFESAKNLVSNLQPRTGLDEIIILRGDSIMLSSFLEPLHYGLQYNEYTDSEISKPLYKIIPSENGFRILYISFEKMKVDEGKSLILGTGKYITDVWGETDGFNSQTMIICKYSDKFYHLTTSHMKKEMPVHSVFLPFDISQSDLKDGLEITGFSARGGLQLIVSLVPVSNPYQGLKNKFLLFSTVLILFGLLFAIIFGLLVTRPFVKRLNELLVSIRLASLGDTESSRLHFKTGDQMEKIGGGFNSLVDEIERQQKILIEGERLRAWRDIARKVAHEIKNPLSPIRISAETLLKAYRKKPEKFEILLEEKVNIISEEVGRIGKTVDEFVSFARLPKPEVSKGDINALVERISLLYEDDERVNLKTIKGFQGEAEFDTSQINRVLHNLIKNAIEAFDRFPGRIEIETALSEGYNNPGLKITVKDNGRGITPETHEKLFQPYFTTKSTGTGLGLLICYNIVHEHGGTIEIDSIVNDGTTVTITLPLKESSYSD